MPEINWNTIMPTYDAMLKSGMHYGRKKTVRHPKMEPFIYSLRDSIHIIDVIRTEEYLRRTIEFLKELKEGGKMILWVGITKQSEQGILDIAQQLRMPYVVSRWLGGTLTNLKTIQQRIKYYEELERKAADANYMKSLTKKDRVDLDRELQKLRENFEGITPLTKLPDALFVTSARAGELPIREARRLGIPIISVINTESDPSHIDYPIPANDNAKSSVSLILETVQKALL